MSFNIIEFLATKEVAIVHTEWLEIDQANNSFCYWPPFWKTRGKLEKAVKQGEPPNKFTWRRFEIRILHSCDDYHKARKKLSRAEVDSDLQSAKEVATRTRKRRISNGSEIVSDDDSSDSMVSEGHKPLNRKMNRRKRCGENIRMDQPAPRLVLVNHDPSTSTGNKESGILPASSNLHNVERCGAPANDGKNSPVVGIPASTPKFSERRTVIPRGIFTPNVSGTACENYVLDNTGGTNLTFTERVAPPYDSLQNNENPNMFAHHVPLWNPNAMLAGPSVPMPQRCSSPGTHDLSQRLAASFPSKVFGSGVHNVSHPSDNLQGYYNHPSQFGFHQTPVSNAPIWNSTSQSFGDGLCTPSLRTGEKSNAAENSDGFQQMVLQKLAFLSAAVSNISEMVSLLLKSRVNDAAFTENLDNNFLTDLPLDTVDGISKLCAALDDSTKKHALIQRLASVGGDRPSDTTYRALTSLMTNTLALKYSYVGQKGKLPFASLVNIKHCLCASVRGNHKTAHSTDKEVEDSIKYWLKKAPTRLKAKAIESAARASSEESAAAAVETAD
ncbi:unnamed protein product [Orchesella dallaii]|uniref:DUF4806 domain-containing protein n=1 Tax=Orchesella dallaii TaxID=48710 RepID=A0ABP1QPI1_9HEXA